MIDITDRARAEREEYACQIATRISCFGNCSTA